MATEYNSPPLLSAVGIVRGDLYLIINKLSDPFPSRQNYLFVITWNSFIKMVLLHKIILDEIAIKGNILINIVSSTTHFEHAR